MKPSENHQIGFFLKDRVLKTARRSCLCRWRVSFMLRTLTAMPISCSSRRH